jgi:Spy/CpxP family protein refolding chaperone
MKENLLKIGAVVVMTVVIIAGLIVAAVAGFAAGQTQGAATASRSHSFCDEKILEQLPTTLNITVDQLDGLRRITDRAKPQLVAVRSDARQKRQAIMDATMSEVATFLTPKQQKKLEELQKARQEEHRAKAKVREVLQPSSLFESQ